MMILLKKTVQTYRAVLSDVFLILPEFPPSYAYGSNAETVAKYQVTSSHVCAVNT